MEKHEDCHYLLESLSDFVDGELRQDLCNEIERHLKDCENCRIVVDTLRKTVSLYRETSAELTPVPTDVRERLYKRLQLEEFIK